MNHTKINNAPNHVRSIYNSLNKNSRNKRRYVVTMNPGRNFEHSVPLGYFLKYFNLSAKFKMKPKQLLRSNKIKVNKVFPKDVKFPVSVLDRIQIQGDKEFQRYLFLLRREKSSFKMVLKQLEGFAMSYPVVDYRVTKSGFEVRTFQNKIFNFAGSTQLQSLKKLGAFVLEDLNQPLRVMSICDEPSVYQLIKLTGKQKLKSYDLLNVEKLDSNYYKLILRSKQSKKQKFVTLNKRDFLKRYTFTQKSELERVYESPSSE